MRAAGQWLTSLVRASASQACGFTPLSFAVSIREAKTAQLLPPSSLPANRAFLRLSAMVRIDRSTALVSISTRPSSRNQRPLSGLPCRQALVSIMATDLCLDRVQRADASQRRTVNAK